MSLNCDGGEIGLQITCNFGSASVKKAIELLFEKYFFHFQFQRFFKTILTFFSVLCQPTPHDSPSPSIPPGPKVHHRRPLLLGRPIQLHKLLAERPLHQRRCAGSRVTRFGALCYKFGANLLTHCTGDFPKNLEIFHQINIMIKILLGVFYR